MTLAIPPLRNKMNTNLQTPSQLRRWFCCFMYLLLSVGVLCWSLFGYALLCVLSSFAIILTKKGGQVALLLLFFWCLVAVNVLWLFFTVPWVGLQCVIVVFLDQTHLLFHTLVVFSFKKASMTRKCCITHKDIKSQATSSLFPSRMIAKLERTQNTAQQMLVFNIKPCIVFSASTLIYLGSSLP